jgi:SAM-dependent methyltransferase
MSAIQPDYETDPDRSAAWDPSWLVAAEDWDNGAGRIVEEGLAPVLDVGCGYGGFAARLPPPARWIGLDASYTMLAEATARPLIQADALQLPFRDHSVGGVVCRNMLYHFHNPMEVIAEAYRVLRTGGLFLAETRSRAQDPELVPGGYPPSTFDAEEAPEIVASVFGSTAVEVEAWDGPFMVLPDRAAVATYARHHQLSADIGNGVATPLTLTKRGCLVWARK